MRDYIGPAQLHADTRFHRAVPHKHVGACGSGHGRTPGDRPISMDVP